MKPRTLTRHIDSHFTTQLSDHKQEIQAWLNKHPRFKAKSGRKSVFKIKQQGFCHLLYADFF